MAFDPFYSSSPSDSGLLDGGLLNGGLRDGAGAPYVGGNAMSRRESSSSDRNGTNVPNRDEYVAPMAGPIDAEAPEDSLRETPLPEGFMARLRGFVNNL